MKQGLAEKKDSVGIEQGAGWLGAVCCSEEIVKNCLKNLICGHVVLTFFLKNNPAVWLISFWVIFEENSQS